MAHTLPPDEPSGENFTRHPEYDALDDGVKALIDPKAFAWLPDSERARFLRGCVEPEGFPDS